eukprot:TRINITY_DN39507_c0_g2_i1.p1 TRINITY_DN39507_c0_g2~~TRINITY_DN39507_c0_g2_i1.p1  ORF type:complete len:417 (-),score=58.14 TRINITY_DN39507_c0_g2_i1:8-1165(-)
MTTGPVARSIRRRCLPVLRKRRLLAICDWNSFVAIGLTKDLATVDGDDFSDLSKEDYERLVEMFAKDAQQFSYIHWGWTGRHLFVILLSATLRHETEQGLAWLSHLRKRPLSSWHQTGRNMARDALRLAVQMGDEKCLEELRSLFERSDTPLRCPCSLLHEAALFGHEHLIETLSRMGDFIDYRDKHGQTPLFVAALHGHVAFIEKLCECGEELETRDNVGKSAMHVAAEGGQVESIAKIQALQTIARSSVSDNKELVLAAKANSSPLSLASWGAVGTMVHDFGAGIHARDVAGNTPLHYAAQFGQLDCITKLCQLGADVNAKNCRGDTPLQHALQVKPRGDAAKTIAELLQRGVDPRGMAKPYQVSSASTMVSPAPGNMRLNVL